MNMNDTAVAIGTFDGLHRGHRSLLQSLQVIARRRHLRSVVVALERPVRAVPGVLATVEEKQELLTQFSLDEVIIVPVDDALIKQSAITFLNDFLSETLHARHIVVGRNFSFGHARHGTVDWLRDNGKDLGIQLSVVAPVCYHRAVISSSRIRTLLLRGQVSYANKLLGRLYSFEGMPERGRGVGRTLGFPTINLATAPGKIIPRGVYLCCASQGGLWLPGVINIGTRPTFNIAETIVPELHLLDFSGVWEDKPTRVYLMKHIRNEIRFKNKAELMNQLAADVLAARHFFR
ncbi:MAG: riboflavin biosynthesis protein RibF [Elusimicrobia bacterium]|nr:riboflavin biosynthesis protein RibF [Elusimicrobiota bacterium]